jgi:NitT/TauT family transport system substrate-binding protein
MKKSNWILVLIFLFWAAVCVCSYVIGNNSQKTNLQTVKVAQFGDVFTYVPLYIADAKGFFEEEGLKVELINTGGDDKTYAAVIGGSAMFGVADPSFVAIANQRGIKGKVIGAIANGMPFWGVTKRNDVPEISEAKMLKPYSVATFAAPSTAYTVQDAMFKEGGLKPNIKQGSFGGLIAMLDAGKADIALELEPNVSTAVKSGARVVYSMSDKYPNFALTGITASVKTLEEKPEMVQHFLNAITKAEQYAYDNPDSTVYYMRKKFPDFDEEIAKNAVLRLLSSNTVPHNAIISQEAWNRAIELRYQMGDLKSKDGVSALLEMSFANKAIKE